MAENLPHAPAIPWFVQITIWIAFLSMGILAVVFFLAGIVTLEPNSSIRLRYLPWFSLATLGFFICWGLLSRRWWAPVAMLLLNLGVALSVLLILFT